MSPSWWSSPPSARRRPPAAAGSPGPPNRPARRPPYAPRVGVSAASGAAALAVVGWFAERSERVDTITFPATVVAAIAAVAAGARFGPTGVGLFDVVGAFVVVLVVTQAADGFGNVDALAASIGA